MTSHDVIRTNITWNFAWGVCSTRITSTVPFAVIPSFAFGRILVHIYVIVPESVLYGFVGALGLTRVRTTHQAYANRSLCDESRLVSSCVIGALVAAGSRKHFAAHTCLPWPGPTPLFSISMLCFRWHYLGSLIILLRLKIYIFIFTLKLTR